MRIKKALGIMTIRYSKLCYEKTGNIFVSVKLKRGSGPETGDASIGAVRLARIEQNGVPYAARIGSRCIARAAHAHRLRM